MNTISISRRRFAHLLSMGAIAAAVRPPIFAASAVTVPTNGIVRLSANENPYGPSPRALQAMNEAFGLAWRYPDEQNEMLIDSLAKLNEVDHDQILLGDGSSEILEI